VQPGDQAGRCSGGWLAVFTFLPGRDDRGQLFGAGKR